MRKNGVNREMKPIEGGVCAPAGFSANGVHCGIRKNKEKKDLALIVCEKRAATAAATLYLLSLPTWLYCTFVYNVNLMILLCAGGAFCFARYAHTKRIGFGVGYAVCIALAMAAKPNAAVAGIALLICALLHALLNRDWRIVLLAVGSILLGRGMLSLIESWYAARSGVVFRYDVTMTARLAMGMQDSLIAAGWYNGYTEMSGPPEMTLEKEKAQAAADIVSRLTWMRENPALAAKFYKEELLTMWLDPAYESVWMGAVSDKTGTMNGLAHMIYRDDTPIRRAMTAYMNAAQNVVFGLSAVGGARLMKKKDDMAALDARAKLGPDKLIGVSAHTVEEALLAEKQGADYLGVGAVFPTSSKSDVGEMSYETLKAICKAVSIPVVAIGGISGENVGKLAGSGICGVAVISAIYAAKDVKAAAADLKATVEEMLRA